MAKKDRVDSAAAPEAVPKRLAGMNAANEPVTVMAPEQLHLIPPPLQDEMVEQILKRQEVFGF